MELFMSIVINLILSLIDVYLIEFCILNTHKIIKKKNIYLLLELIIIFIVNINIFQNIIFNLILYTFTIYIALFNNSSHIDFKDIIPYFIIIIKLITKIIIFIIFEKILNTSIRLSLLNWMTSYAILANFILRYIEYTMILTYLNFKKQALIPIHHFKIISIIISAYFSILIIINTDKLFYFQNIGRTFTFIIFTYNLALIAFNKYQTIHETLERDMLQTNERILAEKKYIERKVEANEDIKRMRHDLKNSYYILNGYANDGNIEEIKKFLETRIGKLDESSALIHMGNSCIDSILNEKSNIMKEKGIEYIENISSAYIGNIDVSDLSLLIGLALDNAIEAAEKSDDKKEIEFTTKNYQEYLILYFKNSIAPDCHPNFDKTSKIRDKSYHGFGVKGIKQFAKMYNGEVKYTIENNKVTLRVTLNVNNG